MKIYFAGSIRGGREHAKLYQELIAYLKTFGDVVTEHIADQHLSDHGEHWHDDKVIHDRDMQWLLSSEVIIAEVSTPSLGVGYEIGRAIENQKKILCISLEEKKHISPMITGCNQLNHKPYKDLHEAKLIIKEFLSPQSI